MVVGAGFVEDIEIRHHPQMHLLRHLAHQVRPNHFCQVVVVPEPSRLRHQLRTSHLLSKPINKRISHDFQCVKINNLLDVLCKDLKINGRLR